MIQVGKWRREVFIPTVNPCVDNPVPADLTRLPRNQTEGHIPKIAITTGKADAIECFVRKTGIADSEFTLPTGTGRVNLFTGGEPVAGGGGQGAAAFAAGFAGGTGTFPFAATALWNNPNKLLAYDILLMSCEGGQFARRQEAADSATSSATPTPVGACSTVTCTITGCATGRSRGRPRPPISIRSRILQTRRNRRSTPASPRAWRSPTGW